MKSLFKPETTGFTTVKSFSLKGKSNNGTRNGMIPQNVGGYTAGRIVLSWRILSYSSILLPGVKGSCSMPDDCTHVVS